MEGFLVSELGGSLLLDETSLVCFEFDCVCWWVTSNVTCISRGEPAFTAVFVVELLPMIMFLEELVDCTDETFEIE